MKTKVIIIDDEKLARDIIKNFLIGFANFELVAECSNGFDGLKAIQEFNPDLVFLDIQMPKITGFEMLELLDNPPYIIFSTAFEEYAIKAFEVNAIDYLLKPYSKERFSDSINKYLNMHSDEKTNDSLNSLVNNFYSNSTYLNRVVIKQNNKIIIVPIDDVKIIEAQDDYVMINCNKGKFLKQKTMKFFEEHLDPNEFIRIHRSFIINITSIKQLELIEKDSYSLITDDGKKYPVSKSGYQKLKAILI
ncbi:MAG: LytTR family transcriptional regulator DNA-binding domain-containing protein [bacterium]